jgi:hypothetical protein
MKSFPSLTSAHHGNPLWQGNNAWNPWQPTVRSEGEHLYDGQNNWLPWGGIDSVTDMDEYLADKAVDTKAMLIVIATLGLMLLHYLSD